MVLIYRLTLTAERKTSKYSDYNMKKKDELSIVPRRFTPHHYIHGKGNTLSHHTIV